MKASVGQIAFGPYCLDTEGPRLLRDGVELELRPQALHALRVLVQNNGRCVGYGQMIEAAWHGISVSRHTVAVTVGEVKRALREFGGWISYHPKLGYRLDVPQSEDLIRNGWHYWQRHTREGFEKALCCFQRAADQNSTDCRAFEGIARCYLMLATFAMKSPREMYQKFLEAHNRAVELSGLTPEMRGDRAQGLHVFELRLAEAESELLHAQRENPRSAGIYIRLAVLYATMKRFDEAVEVLNQAYVVDGLSPILPAAEILVRCCRGEYEMAVACGKKALDLHPYFALGRSHFAQALELSGRLEEALAEYRLACVISPDFARLQAEEARCLARSGRTDEAATIMRALEDLRLREYVDGYPMAIAYDALGRQDAAFEELERAAADGSPHLFMLDIDPRLDGLRPDPRFARLRNRVFRSLALPADSRAARESVVLTTYRTKEPVPTQRAVS